MDVFVANPNNRVDKCSTGLYPPLREQWVQEAAPRNFATHIYYFDAEYAAAEDWRDVYAPRPLPRDEHGELITSAEYGISWMAKVTYTTDFDGRKIDQTLEELPCTFHGPFHSEGEAQDWIEAVPEFGDFDNAEYFVINNVRHF